MERYAVVQQARLQTITHEEVSELFVASRLQSCLLQLCVTLHVVLH